MLRDLYLFVFNAVSCLGWAAVLSRCVANFPSLTNPDFVTFASQVGPLVLAVQTLAVLEVVHAALKLVPSNTWTVFVQVQSRVVMVWGVHYLSKLLSVMGQSPSKQNLIPQTGLHFISFHISNSLL